MSIKYKIVEIITTWLKLWSLLKLTSISKYCRLQHCFRKKSWTKVRRFNSMSIIIKFYDALQILKKTHFSHFFFFTRKIMHISLDWINKNHPPAGKKLIYKFINIYIFFVCLKIAELFVISLYIYYQFVYIRVWETMLSFNNHF